MSLDENALHNVNSNFKSCFSDQQDPVDLQQCPPEFNYCYTELAIDWDYFGNQKARIKRGCAVEVMQIL